MVRPGFAAPIELDDPGPGGSLVLLPHHDDELFISTRVARERRRGARVRVVFLTFGSLYGTGDAARAAESGRALAALGVPLSDTRRLGAELGVFDGSLCDHLPRAAAALKDPLAAEPPSRIYAPAWEAGNPDHDAAHLLAVRLAAELPAAELYEFATYGAAGGWGPVARVMRLNPEGGGMVRRRLTLGEGLRALTLARHFPSQWRSLAGLFPEAFFRLAVLRRERLRRVGPRDYRSPPHAGRLHYERRYGLTFAAFLARVGPFLEAP